jgi:hypothetical protein
MKQLMGFINYKNGYYNFIPHCVFDAGDDEGNVFKPVDRFREYPSFGMIELGSDGQNKHPDAEVLYLHSLCALSKGNPICCVMFDEETELQKIPTASGKEKNVLNIMELRKKKVMLQHRVKKISDVNAFKVVTVLSEGRENFYKQLASPNQERIHVNECCMEGELVMLHEDGKYIGPYEFRVRAASPEWYVLSEKNEQCILEYIKGDSIREYRFVDIKDVMYQDNKLTKRDTVPIDVVFIPDSCARQYMDIISNDKLLERMTKGCKAADLFTEYKNSPVLSDKLPKDIRDKRWDRIITVLNNIEEDKERKKKLLNTIVNTRNDEDRAWVADIITESEEYKSLEKKYDALSRGVRETGDDYVEYEDAPRDKGPTAPREDTGGLEELASTIKKELKGLEERLGKYEKLEQINEAIKSKTGEFDQIEKKNKKLRDQLEKNMGELRDDIKKTINSVTPARVALEPIVTNEILKSAGQYQQEDEFADYKRRSENIGNFCKTVKPKSATELVDYLVKRVQQERPAYTHNEIVNIYTCIVQGFLTIFSGKPGTGKTSMCNIIADSLGLTPKASTVDGSRYVPISVERGWSSKRDLIGYYNPLTRRYDKSNMGIYDALMTLNTERENSPLPFVILLDEANLSPIEYYWSNFMAATEIDKSHNKPVWIDIGTEEQIYIPETLKFIATINNDETTENLSPRLIDRAWVIKLPVTKKYENKASLAIGDGVPADTILWRDLKATFSNGNKSNESDSVKKQREDLTEIYEKFDAYQMEISPRIINVIDNYISAANALMEKDRKNDPFNQEPEQAVLDFVVVQKLLPKINDRYDVYEKLFNELLEICDDNNLVRTKKSINEMIDNKDRNMGYCQFLV